MSVLDAAQIMEIIPHRNPFLLIDTIEEIEPGIRAVGKKCVSMNEPFFAGHKGKTAYFAAINSAKFKRKVVPGDVLMLELELIKEKGPISLCRGKATVDGEVAAVCEITCAIS